MAATAGRPIVEPVDFGTAELVPDPTRPNAWTVLLDGVEQSYVDLTDPTRLGLEYLRRLATVVDAVAPPGAPVRVLHLGGAGLSLPRYVAATRPGSTQRVVERDAALVALVERALPLPADGTVEITVGDARAAVVGAAAGRYDLVLADVYEGARMSASVADTGFAAAVAATLAAGGWYAVNVTDLPPLAFTRTQAATLRASFPQVCLIGATGMLRGRRYGNLVLVATRSAATLPVPALAAAAGRDPQPGRVLHGELLDRFIGGARPLTGRTDQQSH